jgi:site-specific DNA-methyltransferase (cytosine-N4-specific)
LIQPQFKQAFGDINWDGDPLCDDPLSDLHPYPARFIPFIPDAMLERYAQPGMRVLDPFCGSGTTLVSALRADCSATGIDLHPIACLISRVKTRRYQGSWLQGVIAGSALPIPGVTDGNDASLDPIPRVDHWFDKEVQYALRDITASIRSCGDDLQRELLLCALSRIIVRVSRQESDTRYAAIAKNIEYDDVIKLYQRSVRDTCNALNVRPLNHDRDVTILNKDILSVAATDLNGPFDLVITSPPYPNAYEYWLYHKYRMYWLGYDPIAVREREIGARPHYFRKNHQTAADFERQMGKLFGLLGSVTTKTAPLCFVISDSIIHGQRVDNRALMSRAAETAGYSLSEASVRRIPYTRKAFNPAVSPRNSEHVLVFERTA